MEGAGRSGPRQELSEQPLRRWLSIERGQTLVIVAVVLVVLVAFLALVLDMGNIYAQRRRVQNAADAGALAGARALALNQVTSTIESAIREYTVTRNGADSYSATILTRTVVVTASKAFSTYFASIVGVPSFSVWASATSGYGFPGAWQGGLLPTAVHTAAVVLDRDIEIWDDAKTASNPSAGVFADGQRGWLNFNGGDVSNSELVYWVTYGWSGTVNVGMWINGDPGTRTSALHAMDVVRTRTIVFVPIYDVVRPGVMGNGQIDYHIVAFGAFYVQQVIDTGNPKMVKGRFIRYVAPQEGGGTYDTGVRVIGLQR